MEDVARGRFFKLSNFFSQPTAAVSADTELSTSTSLVKR
jgi:hypothetical protein